MMKKNLAFILALVMLVGSLFAVIPMAEGDDASAEVQEKYVPEIAYANVNYIASIDMMFAVPVPASLEEGEEVKVLVWGSREDSISFNYNDINKTVLDPEETKATIGGKEHYVFKYSNLGPDQMLDVVCARPVIVKDGKAVAYGKFVDYSIREYVESAKGNMEGIAAIDDEEVIELLDNLILFGALAQRSTGKYYDAYANDELRKIYVNAIVNGVEKGKFFAGFFKYEEGESFTLAAPFFDGAQESRAFDSEGEELADADPYIDGIQLQTKDEDMVITLHYSSRAVKTFSGATVGAGFEVNNYNDGVVGGNLGYIVYNSASAIMINGVGYFNLSTKPSTSNHYWASVKTIPDPEDPDNNNVVQFTATHLPQFVVKLDTPLSYAGVGDTVESAFTIELELGSNNVPANTSHFMIRNRVTTDESATAGTGGVYLFKIFDGVLKMYDGSAYNIVIDTLRTNSLRKYAFVIDPIAETVRAYKENDDGQMVFAAQANKFGTEANFKGYQAEHEKNLADNNPDNDNLLERFSSYEKFFFESALEFTFLFGVNKGVGQFNDLMTEDKSTFKDMTAVKERAEANYSFLMDNYNIYVGRVYE